MSVRILSASLAALGVALLTSCRPTSGPPVAGGAATVVAPTRPTPATNAPTTGAPATTAPTTSALARHSVQGQQLKAVMANVARLNATLPKDMPEDVESPTGQLVAAAAAAAATAADELARTALGIPAAIEGRPLSEADRAGFVAQATTLHDQALRLRGEAEHLRVEAMQRTTESITATCIACHGRYRDLAGNLDPAKSLAPPATAPARAAP